MFVENKPLYALTIGEFMGLIKRLVAEAVNEKAAENKVSAEGTEEHFNIKQLAEFLKCSKVSVHNYKRLGMPFYRIGRKILFKKTEVLNFMKSIGRKTSRNP